jgi:lysophospholipase L1-like esterase
MALRRHLPALLALLLAAALAPLAAPTGAADPPAVTGPGDVYLALGDSLVTGDEHPDNSAAEGSLPGYPFYLDQLLDQTQPISLTSSLAVSGETSASMLAPGGQLDRAVAFIGAERAAGRRVSPVTLSIGGNDMVAALLPGSSTTVTETLDTYRTNLREILDRLIAALDAGGQPAGDLLIMNYYNPYPNLQASVPFTLNADPDRDVPRFNQIIAEEASFAELAAGRSLRVVDVYSAFRGRETSLTFVRQPYQVFPAPNPVLMDYHPRAEGHRVIARGFAEATGYALQLPRLHLPVTRDLAGQ